MQGRRNSSALVMGLRLSCTNPSIYIISASELTKNTTAFRRASFANCGVYEREISGVRCVRFCTVYFKPADSKDYGTYVNGKKTLDLSINSSTCGYGVLF